MQKSQVAGGRGGGGELEQQQNYISSPIMKLSLPLPPQALRSYCPNLQRTIHFEVHNGRTWLELHFCHILSENMLAIFEWSEQSRTRSPPEETPGIVQIVAKTKGGRRSRPASSFNASFIHLFLFLKCCCCCETKRAKTSPNYLMSNEEAEEKGLTNARKSNGKNLGGHLALWPPDLIAMADISTTLFWAYFVILATSEVINCSDFFPSKAKVHRRGWPAKNPVFMAKWPRMIQIYFSSSTPKKTTRAPFEIVLNREAMYWYSFIMAFYCSNLLVVDLEKKHYQKINGQGEGYCHFWTQRDRQLPDCSDCKKPQIILCGTYFANILSFATSHPDYHPLCKLDYCSASAAITPRLQMQKHYFSYCPWLHLTSGSVMKNRRQ